jgi:hypothetical protein
MPASKERPNHAHDVIPCYAPSPCSLGLSQRTSAFEAVAPVPQLQRPKRPLKRAPAAGSPAIVPLRVDVSPQNMTDFSLASARFHQPNRGGNMSTQRIERAILSCFDKTGLVEFAKVLEEFGVEIISTSGTLKTLTGAGVTVKGISDYTGVREMLDGRVKSLHPKVHAGLLGIREKKVHQEEMQSANYPWIDLIVVNFQPLSELMEKANTALDEVMEHIDIGGNAMIRSGAKNFRYVSVAVNPEMYTKIIHEMKAHDGQIPFPMRYRLAQEAFAYTARYNQTIADYLKNTEPPRQ